MAHLNVWIDEKKPIVQDEDVGDSIESVEELLKKHDDFEKMVLAQESRFNAILRLTLVFIIRNIIIICFTTTTATTTTSTPTLTTITATTTITSKAFNVFIEGF